MANDLPPVEVGLRYRPILGLGQGGMAEVHLAVRQGAGGFNKLLVLKILRSELAADPAMPLQFLAEAQISARMNHPNVVQVYEIIDAARPCIVMEYLEGQSLSAIQQVGREEFSTAMQLRVISDALAGLHYSHELRDYDGLPLDIVHRDVSPQNIFITYDGVTKVLDFGIAKATSAPGGTTTGLLKGKIRYMSREQMVGEPIDRRADVFAAGCLLWQAATHMKLWSGVAESAVMRQLLVGDIPRPSSVRPVDPALEHIIMKALAVEPDERFATAQALRCAIDEYSSTVYPNCSMRDVAAFVCGKFADQREAHAQQVRAALAASTSSRPGTQSFVRPSLSPASASSTVRGMASESMLPAWQARSWPWMWKAGAIGLVLVIGVFLAKRILAPDNQPQVGTTTAPRSVEVHFDVTPREAVITFDSERVQGNPGVLRVPAGSSEHELRVVLDGYVPIVRAVHAERDLSLELTLEKLPAPAAEAPKAEASVDTKAKTSLSRQSSLRPRPHEGAPKTKATACNPPFYFDRGIKTYKPECL